MGKGEYSPSREYGSGSGPHSAGEGVNSAKIGYKSTPTVGGSIIDCGGAKQ